MKDRTWELEFSCDPLGKVEIDILFSSVTFIEEKLSQTKEKEQLFWYCLARQMTVMTSMDDAFIVLTQASEIIIIETNFSPYGATLIYECDRIYTIYAP